jgi:hypothetical protein
VNTGWQLVLFRKCIKKNGKQNARRCHCFSDFKQMFMTTNVFTFVVFN